MALLIRRGPTVDRVNKVFAEGELIYDTTNGQVYVGDNETLGGVSITTYTDGQATDAAGALLDAATGNVNFTYDANTNALTANVTLDGGLLNVVEDTTPQLGGDLSLNNNDITGTGNINITGTVTATSLSGPLTGDVTGNVSGTAGSVSGENITGTTLASIVVSSSLTSVGTLTDLTVTNTISGSVTGNAGTVTNGVYTNTQQTITGEKTFTQTVIGDIKGSVTSSDGVTTLVDAQTKTISATTIGATDLTVSGTLTVNGTTTSINTTTLEVTDKNITIAKGAANAAAANGAGITIDGANATITYNNVSDRIIINKTVQATVVGNLTGDVTGDLTGNVTGDLTGNVTGNVKATGGITILDSGTDGTDAIFTGRVNGNLHGDLYSSDGSYSFPIVDTSSYTIRSNYILSQNIEGIIDVMSDINLHGRATFFTSARAIGGWYSPSGYSLGDEPVPGTVIYYMNIAPRAATFNIPVQFGKYTTTERNALKYTTSLVSLDSNPPASCVGTTATLTFADKLIPFFEVGSTIVVAGVSESGYNGSWTVTACTNTSVSFTVVSTLADGTGGTVEGPVHNGTVIYNKETHKFEGYANGSWVVIGAQS